MQKYKSNIITTAGLAQRNVPVRVLETQPQANRMRPRAGTMVGGITR